MTGEARGKILHLGSILLEMIFGSDNLLVDLLADCVGGGNDFSRATIHARWGGW